MTFGKKVDHITVFLLRSLRKKNKSDSIFFTSGNLKCICGDTLASVFDMRSYNNSSAFYVDLGLEYCLS